MRPWRLGSGTVQCCEALSFGGVIDAFVGISNVSSSRVYVQSRTPNEPCRINYFLSGIHRGEDVGHAFEVNLALNLITLILFFNLQSG